MSARILAIATALVTMTGAKLALAEPMDPAMERLVTNPECKNQLGQFRPQNITNTGSNSIGIRCEPDDAAFTKMINQFGFAFAPTSMHSARTTGIGGFHLSLEGVFTDIDSSADYWKRGTQGPVSPTSNEASIRNNSPQPMLQLYSIKARKGFAFGLEVTGAVGFMPKTSILSGGADVRMALLEGFRTGMLGILPDVSVGGGVRTISGASQFQLTVASLDAQLSKPLAIEDVSVLTPFVGFQYMWIFGDSGLIDLTPATDAIQYCDYLGQDIPGGPDDDDPERDGDPVCASNVPNDFNNNVVFSPVRLQRQRLLAGLTYRYEMVMVGGSFIFDLVDPADAQTNKDDKALLEGEPKQWAMVFELGGVF